MLGLDNLQFPLQSGNPLVACCFLDPLPTTKAVTVPGKKGNDTFFQIW